MKKSLNVEKIKLIAAMLIVGSIGIFVENILLPRALIALSRAFIGALVVLPFFLAKSPRISWDNLKKNAVHLVLSGTALGFNWMFLFEAYNYTTVQVATLCYYMAPIFVILVSPILLKEKLTVFSIICTAGAVMGAMLISGIFGGEISGYKGIILALFAAVLYASIIILNKKISGITGIERTFFQLGISAIVMLVYVVLTVDFSVISINASQIMLLLIVDVLHTGVVYILFFSSISNLPAQTASILSYIDPVSAIIFSGIFLKESMDIYQIIGMIFIIGFAAANEIKNS